MARTCGIASQSIQETGYIAHGYSLSCHLFLYLWSPQIEAAWTAIKVIEK